jgi:hypothetical protein
MAKDRDNLAGSFGAENTGGLLSGFLAEEDEFDRRALWRLGSWGGASVCAVIVALYANQSSIGLRREQVAAADLARQAQQIQAVARESQNETRRLASAIDTLNGDRDRLYTRVTVLEQGLDSVTGSIARQNAVATTSQAVAAPAVTTEPQPAPQNPPQVITPVATTQAATPEKPQAGTAVADPGPAMVSSAGPATASSPAAPAAPLMASKSMMGPPDPAAGKLIAPEAPAKKNITASPMPEAVASAPPADDAEQDAVQAAPAKLVQRTEFAVDVGGANSLGGLRALWRGLLKSRSNAALTTLRPIIVIREGNNGLGMQLRLVAGPLSDAAAAAKICAGLIENEHPCETTVFDGQRLAMKADELPAAAKSSEIKPSETKSSETKPAEIKPADTKPAATKPGSRRRGGTRHVVAEEPAKKPESTSMLSSFFVRR